MNEFLLEQFPALTRAQMSVIDKFYPKAQQFPDSGAFWRAAANAYGNMRYECSGIQMSNTFARSIFPAWNYHYNVFDPVDEAEGLGVPHTVEVNAIFGPENVASGAAPASYSTINANAVTLMQGYWSSFIRVYDPNTFRAKGTPFWETWIPGLDTRIRFETNTTTMEFVDPGLRERCAYLLGIGPELQQ
jgi:carboxylesterase type B